MQVFMNTVMLPEARALGDRRSRRARRSSARWPTVHRRTPWPASRYLLGEQFSAADVMIGSTAGLGAVHGPAERSAGAEDYVAAAVAAPGLSARAGRLTSGGGVDAAPRRVDQARRYAVAQLARQREGDVLFGGGEVAHAREAEAAQVRDGRLHELLRRRRAGGQRRRRARRRARPDRCRRACSMSRAVACRRCAPPRPGGWRCSTSASRSPAPGRSAAPAPSPPSDGSASRSRCRPWPAAARRESAGGSPRRCRACRRPTASSASPPRRARGSRTVHARDVVDRLDQLHAAPARARACRSPRRGRDGR